MEQDLLNGVKTFWNMVVLPDGAAPLPGMSVLSPFAISTWDFEWSDIE